jgi:hypothetical protein
VKAMIESKSFGTISSLTSHLMHLFQKGIISALPFILNP